ncbi:uncharacterized protein LOC110773732 [Prunus avium]|uniref:Uncharacterized protein LOC110773732 n=1 Tax=Prunus avium TaxID=42229 RepID=A0A6P5U3P7_PRUAV|nr:uncharacterized protein LOC110773732 [Prunus avium]XP_021833947.1 uncharacterized protein LOC110773732 [Prunus avium]
MDSQDLARTHSSGLDSHGVHVCHKCGWPFPNAHPSARHRRAHKRICGTIDGYKLAGSEKNTHVNDSDDEHSDEERKTPNLVSVRSEDVVFSDAVAEFSDSASGAGTGEGLENVRESEINLERVAKNGLNVIQSLNDGEITENTTNQLGAQELQGSLSTSNIISMTSSESALQDDRNHSEDDVHPIQFEVLADASEDSKKTHATDSVIESSLLSAPQEDKIDEIATSNLDRDLPYTVISPNKVVSETAEGVSKLEGTVEMTSDSLRDNEVVPSEKEYTHAYDLYIPQIDPSPEVESVEHVNASVDTVENKVDTTDGIHYSNSGGLTESSNWEGEGNANVHVLSVPDDTHVVENPEAMLEGFKNHKEKKLDQAIFLDSWEQFNDEETDVKRGGSSKPMVKEVPAEEEPNVSHIQIKITENQRSDEIAAPANANESLQLNFSESDTKVLSDPNSLIASSSAAINQTRHLDDLDGNGKDEKCDLSADHSSKGSAEENSVENPAEIEINPAANLHENGDAGDYEKGIFETCNIIGDSGYHETENFKLAGDDNSKESTENFFAKDPVSNLESASRLSELQVNPVSSSHEVGDAGDYEKDKTERFDIIGDDGDHEKAEKDVLTGDDYRKVSTEKIVAENPITSLESASSLSELQANLATNLNDDDPGDHDGGEIEKSIISGNESREGPVEKNLLVKPTLNLDSAIDLVESKAVAEDAVDGSMLKLVDTKHKPLNSSSNSSGVGLNIVSDHGPDAESTQKSSEGCGMKELGLSALDAESSVLSFTAEDNGSREFRGVSSGLSSQSFQEESDKNFVRQQPSSSALDVVDSNSQTDSLEGNWGSVSVLSIQSDAQAIPPTDSQTSVEEQKSKAASERQYPEKSDMFEAPSFMTLVEPRGVNDQKATAAEIHRAHNLELPKPAPLQAGWFPSISHVVNESPGRKKNEEIIAKVTNWSTGKQHTPLKNLLGEAYLENKAKSPTQKESQTPAPQKDDKAVKVKDGGPGATTVNSILGPESPTGQASKKENAKEWNSPARYPSDIKSEKKKVKGRPYWAQFVCCSSVH